MGMFLSFSKGYVIIKFYGSLTTLELTLLSTLANVTFLFVMSILSKDYFSGLQDLSSKFGPRTLIHYILFIRVFPPLTGGHGWLEFSPPRVTSLMILIIIISLVVSNISLFKRYLLTIILKNFS